VDRNERAKPRWLIRAVQNHLVIVEIRVCRDLHSSTPLLNNVRHSTILTAEYSGRTRRQGHGNYGIGTFSASTVAAYPRLVAEGEADIRIVVDTERLRAGTNSFQTILTTVSL
jgi:hypothetical protein